MASKKKPDATPRAFGHTHWPWLPWPRLLSDAARLRFALLAELQALVEDTIEGRTADIERTYRAAMTASSRDQNGVEEYGERLAEEVHQLADIKREARLLHAVSLYHRLENELKTIFAWRFSGLAEAEKKNLMWGVHKWKGLHDLTQYYFKFAVASVANYRAVDKLRCIANAVKHNRGNVDSELQKMTRWPLNKPIDVAKVDLNRLREDCVGFIANFAEKAERSMREMFGPPQYTEVAGRKILRKSFTGLASFDSSGKSIYSSDATSATSADERNSQERPPVTRQTPGEDPRGLGGP